MTKSNSNQMKNSNPGSTQGISPSPSGIEKLDEEGVADSPTSTLFERIANGLIICGYILLMALIPLVILPWLNDSAISGKVLFSRVLLIITTTILVIKIFLNGRYVFKPNILYLPLIVFLLLYFLPSMVREPFFLIYYVGIGTVLWVLSYFVIANVFQSEKSLHWLLGAIIFGGSVAAIYGLLQYMNQDFLQLKWLGRQMTGKEIMISTFGNANYFASYLVPITLLVVGWWVLGTVNPLVRFLGIVLGVILIITIALSGVRATWIELPCALVMGILLYFRTVPGNIQSEQNASVKGKWLRTGIWIIIAILLIILFSYLILKYQAYKMDWLLAQVRSLKNIHELEQRFLVWQISLQMIRNNPIFGLGLNQFFAQFFSYLGKSVTVGQSGEYESVLNYIKGSNAVHSHNDYLQLTAETGVLTVSILLFIFILFYRNQIALLRRNQNRQWHIRHIALLVSVLPILFDGLFNFPFYLPAHGLLFWVLMGITVSHGYLCPGIDNEKSKIIKFPQWIKPVGVVSAVLLCIGLIILTINIAKSEYYLKHGIYFLQAKKWDEALQDFSKSMELYPYSGQAHLFLGKVYGIKAQMDKAIPEFVLAEKYGADDLGIYEDPAVLYYYMKDFQKSAEQYEKLLVFYPNHYGANRQLAYIYTKYLPTREKAIYYIQKYLLLSPPDNERAWFQEQLDQLQKQG